MRMCIYIAMEAAENFGKFTAKHIWREEISYIHRIWFGFGRELMHGA